MFNQQGVNVKLKLLAVAVTLGTLSACGTVSKDRTKYTTISSVQEIQAPDWFNRPPVSTKDQLYVTGTSSSVNYGSSRQKALLDAQVMLGDKVNGEMNALVQQFQNDVGSSFITNTTTNVKKLIAETDLTGYSIEQLTTIRVGNEYQTFVLLRYPIGEANDLLKHKLAVKAQRESTMRATQGQIDLNRELDRKNQRETARDRRTQEIVAPDTVSPERKLPHETVTDPKVKAQVEEAIRRGNAIILTETVR